MSARSNAPTSLDRTISERIRMVRTQRGMTLKDAAAELGTPIQQLHKIESGLNRVSAGMLIRFADVLKCQITDFVPPELLSEEKLEEDIRIDLLKQDIAKLVLNCQSEQVLIAFKTLLSLQKNSEEEEITAAAEQSPSVQKNG